MASGSETVSMTGGVMIGPKLSLSFRMLIGTCGLIMLRSSMEPVTAITYVLSYPIFNLSFTTTTFLAYLDHTVIFAEI